MAFPAEEPCPAPDDKMTSAPFYDVLGLLWRDRFEIETLSSPTEVRAKLQRIIGETPVFAAFDAMKRTLRRSTTGTESPFIGALTEEGFQIRVRSDGRQRWRPEIYGTIQPNGGGTVVRVSIRFRRRVTLFAVAGILYPLIILGLSLLANRIGGAAIEPFVYIFATVMPISTYVITTGMFWEETNAAKKILIETLRDG